MALDSITAADLPLAFGQMQLVRLLEEHPGSRLFLAESPGQGGLPPEVAVLVVRPHRQRSAPTSMNDLLADLQRARTLRHPGISQTFACGVQDDVVFVVSELPAGPDLAQLVAESGRLPLQSAVAIVAQVGLALEHAHQLVHNGRPAPLVHRHLRPEAVAVGADGKVKLSGFGLAELLDSYSPVEAGPTSALCFASPEVLAGQTVSPSSDIFSLGVLLAYVTLGEAPFEVPVGAQKAQYLSSIVRALADGGLAAKMDGLADGLGAIMQGMVALDPSGRPGSVGEVVAELRGLLEADAEVQEQEGDGLAEQATLGHQGPPGVTEASLAVEVEEETQEEDPRPAAPVPGRPAPPPVPVPQRPIVAAPPAVPPRGPLTSSAPTPKWAHMLDVDEVPTDEASQPGISDMDSKTDELVPTDRMSALFYRQQRGDPDPDPPGVAPTLLGPGTSGQQPIAPKPGDKRAGSGGRPSRRKRSTPLLPLLLLMVFLVFSVLAVLGALLVVKVSVWDKSDPPQEAMVPLVDDPVMEAGPPVEERAAVADSEPVDAASADENDDKREGELEDEEQAEPAARAAEVVQPRAPPISRSAEPTGTAAELAISHRPRSSADSGASDLISVRVTGPVDTRVQVYFGPEGGPFKSTDLRRRGTGRWEGWLTFDVAAGEVLEYWVVASHADAEEPVFSGSGSQPHRVRVR